MKARVVAFDDFTGGVDPRHMRQLADHARMALGRQRILEIERRVFNLDEDIAGRQLGNSSPGNSPADGAIGVLFD